MGPDKTSHNVSSQVDSDSFDQASVVTLREVSLDELKVMRLYGGGKEATRALGLKVGAKTCPSCTVPID